MPTTREKIKAPRKKEMDNLYETLSVTQRKMDRSVFFLICPERLQEQRCTPVIASGTNCS
jgi:hypothetical protein